MKKQMIASESFSGGKQHYFLDIKRADNNSTYLQITRSEQQPDGSYKRWPFVVFEEHLELFISAFASLFQQAAYPDPHYQTVQELHEEVQASGIKGMPENKRPREKLMQKGATALTNAELLALLIGSGSVSESAIALAERILGQTGKRVAGLKHITLSQLCSLNGMGVAKSCSILAAVELGRRLHLNGEPNFKTVYIVRYPGDDREDYLQSQPTRN